MLYSVVARYGAHTETSSSQALKELVGGKSYTAEIDLPSRIVFLLSNTPLGREYSAAEILARHTLFPVLCGFVEQQKRDAIAHKMYYGNMGASLKSILGLSGVRRTRQLYYCPICMEYDIATFGEPFWHRVHRVPGVLICPAHGVYLRDGCPVCGDKFRPGKHEFLSIGEFCPNGHALREQAEPVGTKLLERRLAGYAEDVLFALNSGFYRPLSFLKGVFREKLFARGLMTEAGIVKLTALGQDFFAYYGEDFLSSMECRLDLRSNDNWLFRVFRSRNKAVAPEKILLIIRFLFGSLSAFFDAVNCQEQRGDWLHCSTANRVDVGVTISKVYKRVKYSCLPTTTALYWRHYEKITLLMEAEPGLTRSQLKMKARDSFNWLMNHDRKWLLEHLPKPLSPKEIAARREAVDWSARDEKICFCIQEAVLSIRLSPGRPLRVTKRNICDFLGVCNPYQVGGEKRLPKARALFKKEVETIEDFETRKVHWAVGELLRNGARITASSIRVLAGISRRRPTTDKAIADMVKINQHEGESSN